MLKKIFLTFTISTTNYANFTNYVTVKKQLGTKCYYYLFRISVNALTSSSTTNGWPFTWLNW